MREIKIGQTYTQRTESLDAYLKMINKEPMISADEEVDLAIRIHHGDKRALDMLVRANLRFVVSIAKQYARQNAQLDLMDLIDEGNLGLITAAQRFDETLGFKFISYAVWWIRQHILLALSEQASIIRQPQNQVNNIGKVNRAIAQFEQENERRPTADELADILGMAEDKVVAAINGSQYAASIDAPNGGEEDDRSVAECITYDNNECGVDDSMKRESLSADLDEVLDSLSYRDKTIVCLCFGIGGEQFTMDEIGQRFNLSRERVRQIKERCIRSLRNNPSSRALRTYLS